MKQRPNILFLHTDQLNRNAIGANGCTDAATPNLDRLFGRGVSFCHSSVANPICMPSRTSWYTGLMSEEHGQLSNDRAYDIDPKTADIGPRVRSGGYDTVYMGKWHIAKSADKSFDLRFNGHVHGEVGDAHIARAAEAFLASRQGDKPFFLNVGLLNPHDSCMWAYNFTPCSPAKSGLARSLLGQLPSLPPNHRLAAYPTIGAAADPTGGAWSDLDWRFYLYSYYRQVEMVDAEIGRILGAVENSRFADNTVVIFSSDHGDGLAQHYHYGKDCLFDHGVMTPLVVVDPSAPGGRRDSAHMISNIDLAATVCDYAGVDPLPHRRGLSLRPLVQGKTPAWRPYAAASAVEARLRMIRTPDHKLIHDRATNQYALYDLAADPWEMTDVAGVAAKAGPLAQLKGYLSANEATYHYAPQAARMVQKWEGQALASRRLEARPPGVDRPESS